MQTNKNLNDLQRMISKVPQPVLYTVVLPEVDVRWRDVSRAVRNARLPMKQDSIARVLCKHIAKTMSAREIEELIFKLRLKFVATQNRRWHVFKLSEPMDIGCVEEICDFLPQRIEEAIVNRSKTKRPRIEMTVLREFVFFSVQIISNGKEGTLQYYATPLGTPLLLASSPSVNLSLKASVEGLGYNVFENMNLHGSDILSLIRIANDSWTAEAPHLEKVPEYNPTPVITASGIDYTNRTYDTNYVDSLIGQNPPLLTEVTINSSKMCYDRSLCDKFVNIKVQLKSENVALSLKSWVMAGALNANSDLFHIFHKKKSNCIEYAEDDSD